MSLNDLGFLAPPTVLVIDDDPDLRDLIAHVMEPWATVLAAGTGDEGLQLCRLAMPDLVLLDVQMPGLDGFDVINELKHDSSLRHIPVVFITGEDFVEVESECLESGAVDYIAKPINPRVLTSRVRTHVLLKQQSDRLSELAALDGLTGTMSRHVFDDRLRAELNRARRTRETLAFAVVDIDDFTGYNAQYGHLAGDALLTAIVGAARTAARRETDVVARIAAGRLAILLPDTSADEAARIASGIVDDVAALSIPFRAAPSGRVSVRIGVADTRESTTAASLLNAAHQAACGPTNAHRALTTVRP